LRQVNRVYPLLNSAGVLHRVASFPVFLLDSIHSGEILNLFCCVSRDHSRRSRSLPNAQSARRSQTPSIRLLSGSSVKVRNACGRGNVPTTRSRS